MVASMVAMKGRTMALKKAALMVQKMVVMKADMKVLLRAGKKVLEKDSRTVGWKVWKRADYWDWMVARKVVRKVELTVLKKVG